MTGPGGVPPPRVPPPGRRVPGPPPGPPGPPGPRPPQRRPPPPDGPTVPGGGDLAARQAALVDALVGGAPDPPGFAPDRLAATRRALLRKRAGAAAATWPQLAASLGPDWLALFTASAGDRPPPGALADGWDLARTLHRRGELGLAAAVELAEREVALHYDGRNPPRRRRGPALRRVGRLVLVHVAGRTLRVGRAR